MPSDSTPCVTKLVRSYDSLCTTSKCAVLLSWSGDQDCCHALSYTVLHLIVTLGHGFGLPHTDERFWNRDQGNCMDYTNRK